MYTGVGRVKRPPVRRAPVGMEYPEGTLDPGNSATFIGAVTTSAYNSVDFDYSSVGTGCAPRSFSLADHVAASGSHCARNASVTNSGMYYNQ